jgi:hypothetical protein
MYLYGDSTVSELDTNLLGVLPEALDFCVCALLADEHIERARAERLEIERDASQEVVCLRCLDASIKQAIAEAPKGLGGAQTSHCAATLEAASDLALKTELANVQEKLDRSREILEEREHTERDGALKALEALLLRNDFPGTIWSLHLVANGTGAYVALLRGDTGFGLRWTIDLDLSGDATLERVGRMERIIPHLDVHAPEMSGWLRKVPSVRALKLDRLYLADLDLSLEGMKMALSSDASGGGPGVLLELLPKAPFGRATRTDLGEGETFSLEERDLAPLRALHVKLLGMASAVASRRRRLVGATLDDVPLLDHPAPRLLVERLIAAMAPITRAIVEHSGAPGELVLKKVLDDNHREEIFVSKKDLLARLAPLSPAQQALFAPLGLADDADPLPPARPLFHTGSWASEGASAADGLAVVAENEARERDVEQAWGQAE